MRLQREEEEELDKRRKRERKVRRARTARRREEDEKGKEEAPAAEDRRLPLKPAIEETLRAQTEPREGGRVGWIDCRRPQGKKKSLVYFILKIN